MSERELPDVVVFDRMSPAIRRLIGNCAITDKVKLVDRTSMLGGNGIVTEVQPTLLPVHMWSTGEKVLWTYLASLAGQGTCNLYELANYFRGSGYIVQIIEAFESVAGLVGADE